jgi:hypothetical protein
MEIDQPALQLYFNVVMIASVGSLAALCYLLRRANQQLTSELEQLQAFEHTTEPSSNAQPTVHDPQVHQSPINHPPVHRDIREFVAHRSQKWGVASAGAGVR